MNRLSLFGLMVASAVPGALMLTASPAVAQSRTFRATVHRPMIFQTTTPMRITNFNSPHAAVPVQSARAVIIDPFLHTSVASLNSRGSVVAFNPFVATNALVTFPNAHAVLDPFRVSPAFFSKDLPMHGRGPVTSSPYARDLRAMMYGNMMYGNMMNGGYGSGGYGAGMMAYGGGYGGGSSGSAPVSQPTMVTSPTPSTGNVSANVEWPIGLRVLPPTADTDRVRQLLQADLEALSNSTSAEQAAALKADAIREVKKLRGRLDDVGYKLASGTVADARRFLDQVEASLQSVP